MQHNRLKTIASVSLIAIVLVGLIVTLWLLSDPEESPARYGAPAEGAGDDRSIETASELRLLLDEIGGIDARVVATAVGAFDMVRFDPLDSDRLLAANRLSYGDAQNQHDNELWTIRDGNLEQRLWSPDVAHDFAHFNPDGSITRWVHGGGDDFAPRIAQLLDRDLALIAETMPMYASRFTVVDDTVFALLGDGRYGSTAPYLGLVADDGGGQRFVAAGSNIEWINSPAPSLLVAYPTQSPHVTRVWTTTDLAELTTHALAGKSYQRAAISGDGAIAIGVTLDGVLEVIDLRTGEVTHRFGQVDVDGIDTPVTLSDDGTRAVVVERDGTVGLWAVGDGELVVSMAGNAAQPRWVSEQYAARSASAVAHDATRVAVQHAARPGQSTSWSIIDLDPVSWSAAADRLG